MEDKNILVIYNICGIKFDNIKMWMNHLEDIINQNYSNFKIVVSGCKVSEGSKQQLLNFKDKCSNISFNWVDEILPISVTFNQTVQICTEEFGLFDAYFYIASDVKFGNDKNVISKMVKLHFESNSAITSAMVDNDHGLDGIYHDCWNDLDELLNNDHFCINIGRGANMHAMIFDKEIYLNFNNKIIPDIFASHHIENTFVYIAASLSKKFVVHSKDVMLGHIGFADGHAVGFMDEIKWDHTIAWKHLFKSKIPAEERLLNDEAKKCGFGYGGTLLLPNEEMYDEDENHKDPSRLLSFLKPSIYLSDDEYNYKDITYNFIK
jgi:hypothetical protein